MRSASAVLLEVCTLAVACSVPGARGTSRPRSASGTASAREPSRTAALRDVVAGEEFPIDDLAGKVVAIQAMAIRCVNSRMQQREAQAALEKVGSPDVLDLSDVDPNERAADLADYARREGFGWRFAVAPPEGSRALAATFGDQILSPPATPLVVLGPDEQDIEKHIGIKRADDFAALIEKHLP